MRQSHFSEFSSPTKWRIPVVQQRTDNGEQMPQEQFQRVKQNQNPSPESSDEDRDSTVTACTGRMRPKTAHTTLEKTFEERDILSIRLLSALSAEQPEPGASRARFERSSLPPRSSRQ